MFALVSTAVLALAATASAAPSRFPRSAPVAVISSSSPSSFSSGSSISSSSSGLSGFSLDNWGGFDCLSNFDSFYGSDNFCGNLNSQTVLSETVTCESQSIDFVQQQLAVLTEFAKRVVLTQVCQVEVQTIVWSQFVSSVTSFSSDITHVSGRSIGYDSHVASFISDLVNSSDEIIVQNFGFSGTDIGSNLIAPTGFNWVSGSSEVSVQQALIASQVSELSSTSSFVNSGSFGHSSSSVGGFGGFGASSGTFNVASV